nr:MAG TPA: hypothetical protein [Caudoviricetes sp.]
MCIGISKEKFLLDLISSINSDLYSHNLLVVR